MHLEEIVRHAERPDSVAGLMRLLFASFPPVTNKIVPPGLGEADIKKMLEVQRTRAAYFSKSRVGTAVGLPEFDVKLKPEFADKPPPNVPARPLSKEQHEAAPAQTCSRCTVQSYSVHL